TAVRGAILALKATTDLSSTANSRAPPRRIRPPGQPRLQPRRQGPASICQPGRYRLRMPLWLTVQRADDRGKSRGLMKPCKLTYSFKEAKRESLWAGNQTKKKLKKKKKKSQCADIYTLPEGP
ncbi:hypothetical protein CCMA1212_003391, partial [Trichoderma ghanense]